LDEQKNGTTTENGAGTEPGETVKAKPAKPKKERRIAAFKIGKKEFRIPVRTIVIIAACTLAAALLTTGGVFAYRIFIDPLSAFDSAAKSELAIPEPEESAAAPTLTPTLDPLQKLGQQADRSMMNGIVNVALIGVDYAPERADWKKYTYSDVMIVLAINFKENKVDMISMPRDTYTPIFNTKGKYKLNSSFYWGGGKEKQGFEYVCKSIETLLGGITVPYYIGVDIPAVKTLVDAVGGVDYDVDLKVKMQGRVLEKGMQHLDGQQALDYIRGRHNTAQPTDLQRVLRQRDLLVELFRQIKNNGKLIDIPKLLQSLSGQVKTNMSLEQMCALAYFGMNLDESKITSRTMPGDLVYMIYNWNYVIIDQAGRVKLIREVYGADVPEMHEYSLGYCKREWARMQARRYMSLVQRQISKDAALPPESQKLTEPGLSHIKARLSQLKAAYNSGSTAAIQAANTALKNDAGAYFHSIGIGINWFVNENPGLPRLTG
jgi:LCP family protein required for cell wall assembly